MPLEMSSVLTGGAIGLLSGLGGVFLGHMLTRRRESNSRAIEGIKTVLAELETRRRLSLDIGQHISQLQPTNIGNLPNASLWDIPTWKDLTLAIHERPWLFPCTAYLPEAVPDFEKLDVDIIALMDPAQDVRTGLPKANNDETVIAINVGAQRIRLLAQKRINELLK
jgi:hypothetical protein